MAYLVLARKWRPQSFSEVIDQEPVVRALQNAVRYGRVAHAFLFAGARGVGKTSVARILAKALNCQDGPTPTPCNQCSTCQEITRGSAVDVYEIDGASNRGIDEIRELRENAKYLPAQCRYKIYIIDEVHMLTAEAFNALLKTLEEPPPHVIFIFATTEPHKVPITILSRCQRYDFKRLSRQAIIDHLKVIIDKEGIKLGEGGLHFIARETEGSMRDALSLLDRIISYGGDGLADAEIASVLGLVDHGLITDMMQALFERNLEQGLEIIDRVHTHGHDLKRFYADLVEAVRNLIIIKTCSKPDQLINITEEERKELNRIGQSRSVETIYQYLQLLLKGWDELRRSFQPKLTFEMIVMRMNMLKDIVPVERILEKLSALAACIAEDTLQHPHKQTAGSGPEKMPTDKKPFSSRESEIPSKAGKLEDREAFISFVKNRNLPLASILQQCKDLSLKDDTLSIIFTDLSLCELLKDSLYSTRLKAICQEYYRREMKIDIASDQAADSACETVHRVDYECKVREEILQHPLVQETMNIFGGHIEGVDVEKN